MFCGKCGANISEGMKKCPNCGTPLRKNEFLGGFQDILRTDVSSIQSFRQQDYSAPVQPVYGQKKNNTLLFIAAGIAVLSLLMNIFLGMRLISKNKTIKELTDSAGQGNGSEKAGDSAFPETPSLTGDIPEDTISGFVYLDSNKNGIYEPSEDRPLDDLEVELHMYSGDGLTDSTEYMTETYTDPDGIFSFDGLKEGYYRIILKTDGNMQISEGAENISSIFGQGRPGIKKIMIPDHNNTRYSIGLVRILQNTTEEHD